MQVTQCVDIIFAEPGDKRIPEVNETNCFNSTHFGFAQQYTVTTKARDAGPNAQAQSKAVRTMGAVGWYGVVPLLGGITWLML